MLSSFIFLKKSILNKTNVVHYQVRQGSYDLFSEDLSTKYKNISENFTVSYGYEIQKHIPQIFTKRAVYSVFSEKNLFYLPAKSSPKYKVPIEIVLVLLLYKCSLQFYLKFYS